MKRESIIRGYPTFAAFLIFVILTSGCIVGPKVRTYSGNKLQKSEVAVIRGWCYFALFGYECVDIYRIDGSLLEATNVEVLPGWYELVIRWYSVSFVAPVGAPPDYALVRFSFEAGHEYKIKGHFKGVLMKGIDIVDVSTGTVIVTGYW
jgi:hypothetical protein